MINIKNLVLGIGIFIVFMFLLHNGIRAFYEYPEYNDFCTLGRLQGYYPDKAIPAIAQNCTFPKELRDAEQQCYAGEGQPIYEYDEYGCTISVKECDYCQKEYNDTMKTYNKNVFVVALIAGILILLTGYLILSVEPVGSALMASGIGAIIYGTIVNWENLGNLGRFLLLLLAFVLLVWIALRLNRKEKSKWMFWRR